MDVDVLESLSLFEDNVAFPCPALFKGYFNFAAGLAETKRQNSSIQEFLVVTVPQVDGIMASMALGTLYSEVKKIRRSSNISLLSVQELEVGMHVSVFCGSGGWQADGEVTYLGVTDKEPRITVGGKQIAVKSIREIVKLSEEVGDPRQFKKRVFSSNSNPQSLMSVLLDSSVPINRSIVTLRSTTQITDREFTWKLFDAKSGQEATIEELIKPLHVSSEGIGLCTVLNSSADEQLAWMGAHNSLSQENLNSGTTILCSSPAVIAQLENVGSPRVIAILGRDDRQISAAATALRDSYAYSREVTSEINLSSLPKGTEFFRFGRTQ